MRKIVFVLLGAPASGKGTLRGKILKNFQASNIECSVIEMSSILKQNEKFQSIISSGALVKDEAVIEAIKEPLKNAGKIVILDGFPRTVKQAEFLLRQDDLEVKVLKLEADEKEIVERAKSRRVCPKCGATYNLLKEELTPRKKGICDKCGSRLKMREDDKMIEKRLKTYRNETVPTAKYLERQNIGYYEIDSNLMFQEDFAEELLYNLGM